MPVPPQALQQWWMMHAKQGLGRESSQSSGPGPGGSHGNPAGEGRVPGCCRVTGCCWEG